MNEEIDDDMLLKSAQLGIETEVFLRSEIGKRMLEKAEQGLQEGVKRLLNVKPSDTDELLDAQNQCKRAIEFKTWVNELIIDGKHAEELLQDE